MANTTFISLAVIMLHYLNFVHCLFDRNAQNNLAVYWGE